MEQGIDFRAGNRRALRRAVSIDCSVMSRYWDGPVRHTASDLSPYGLWVDAIFPLEPGELLAVSFTPPRWRLSHEIIVFAEVRRAVLGRRQRDDGAAGMGLEFLDLKRPERAALDALLKGLPPPLPRARNVEDAWIDVPFVIEEDLGDRVNTWELSAPIALLDDDEAAEMTALGELLTGTRRRLRAA